LELDALPQAMELQLRLVCFKIIFIKTDNTYIHSCTPFFFQNGRAGGTSGVKAEHVKQWLRIILLEEEKGIGDRGPRGQVTALYGTDTDHLG